MLELDDGRVLAESNAILCWLAEGTPFLPADAWQRAQALSWMFFEQYSHEPYVAVARFICGWTPPDSPRRADVAATARARPPGAGGDGTASGIGSRGSPARTTASPTSRCSPTPCVADHGGFDLDAYPAIRDWLARVTATPGFVPMPEPTPPSRR